MYKATWPEQKLYTATLATLGETAQRHGIKPPTLLVIGSVVSLVAPERSANRS